MTNDEGLVGEGIGGEGGGGIGRGGETVGGRGGGGGRRGREEAVEAETGEVWARRCLHHVVDRRRFLWQWHLSLFFCLGGMEM